MENLQTYAPLLIGPAIGFTIFLIGVSTLENVLYRQDTSGNKKFSLNSLYGYFTVPFTSDEAKRKMMWGVAPDMDLSSRLKMLNLNWVAMTLLGTAGSVIYYKLRY